MPSSSSIQLMSAPVTVKGRDIGGILPQAIKGVFVENFVQLEKIVVMDCSKGIERAIDRAGVTRDAMFAAFGAADGSVRRGTKSLFGGLAHEMKTSYLSSGRTTIFCCCGDG